MRPIRPQDKDLLVAGLRLLSPETVQRRFLSPKPRLTSSELRYLTEVDGHDHVAFVAVRPDRPGTILAVARYVALDDRAGTAEAAIVVADPLQGLGLGTILADELAREAVSNGVRRFSADDARREPRGASAHDSPLCPARATPRSRGPPGADRRARGVAATFLPANCHTARLAPGKT